jgi:hypothetical protein
MRDKPHDKPGTEAEKKDEPRFNVFISHASEDTNMARSLCNALSDRGVTCWFDEKNLKAGGDWNRTILEAIDRSKLCLLVLTKASMASKPWVSKEWSFIQASAWKRDDLVILPIILDQVETPTFLHRWQSLRCNRRSANIDTIVAEIVARIRNAELIREKEPSEHDRSATVQRFREIARALEKEDSSESRESIGDPDE